MWQKGFLKAFYIAAALQLCWSVFIDRGRTEAQNLSENKIASSIYDPANDSIAISLLPGVAAPRGIASSPIFSLGKVLNGAFNGTDALSVQLVSGGGYTLNDVCAEDCAVYSSATGSMVLRVPLIVQDANNSQRGIVSATGTRIIGVPLTVWAGTAGSETQTFGINGQEATTTLQWSWEGASQPQVVVSPDGWIEWNDRDESNYTSVRGMGIDGLFVWYRPDGSAAVSIASAASDSIAVPAGVAVYDTADQERIRLSATGTLFILDAAGDLVMSADQNGNLSGSGGIEDFVLITVPEALIGTIHLIGDVIQSSDGAGFALGNNASDTVTLDGLMKLTPLASAPYTCNAGNKFYVYADSTTNLLYFCNGTAWTAL